MVVLISSFILMEKHGEWFLLISTSHIGRWLVHVALIIAINDFVILVLFQLIVHP